jgi:predicted phage tail protein
MKTIHLYGRLASEFGPRFDLEVRSIAEAVRALEVNFPGRFFKAIREGAYHLAHGKDVESGDSLDESMLTFRFGRGDFHLTPVVQGAGSGDSKAIATIVIGVAIIGATIISGGTALAPLLASGDALLLGASLVLSGVSILLTPTPQVPDIAETQNDENGFFYGAPVNVIEQGGPVRVVYGQMRVGSILISGGIDVATA